MHGIRDYFSTAPFIALRACALHIASRGVYSCRLPRACSSHVIAFTNGRLPSLLRQNA